MSTLQIAPDLELPLESVTQTFAILAKRGVGKTYTAAVLVEELLKAHLQVIVVDPIGVWWGLRAAADGVGAGLPIVVLGGDHGDIPLRPEDGELVADLLIDERLSAVIDLGMLRKGEQIRFMEAFAERLYHRNREPLHLVLDEADAYAPQRPAPGAQRLLGAIEDLVRRGRARGLGITLVTQRAAVLNKDVLTQVEVLVALRTIAPQDRDAIDAWIRVHGSPEQREALMTSLPSLPIGTAWFWSPGWLDLFQRVNVRRRETFDSSATPKVGQVIKPPKRLADVDIERIRERLAATIAKVATEDPKLLRRRIVELEQELKKRPVGETRIERVEVPVLDQVKFDLLLETSGELHQLGTKLLLQADDMRAELKAAMMRFQAEPAPRIVPPPEARPQPRPAPTVPALAGAVQLRAGERRMLEVLARHHEFRVSRTQLATLAGYTASGGTFGTYFSTLKRHELLLEQGGTVQITPAGLAYLGMDMPPPPQTTAELLEQWSTALRSGERKMLQELVDRYPVNLSRGELAAVAGYEVSGGTFGTYLSTLKRNGLVVVHGDQVSASETLFLGT